MVAALLAALAVAAGAFGAHALRGHLDAGALAIYETAARYQLVHALAAVFAADRSARAGGAEAARAGVLFVIGISLFAGSLYALALGAPRLLGAVTPLGGVALIAGWVLLAASFRSR